MPHYTTWTLKDYSDENTRTRVYHGAVTAVSIGGFLTAVGAGRTALDAITTGTMHAEQWTGDNTILSQTPPTNPFSQRELKWHVSYTGNTSNKTYELEIGTADPSGVDGEGVGRLVPGTDLANLQNEDIAAWVTWFQGFGRTPDSDTENVTVQEIRLVGRTT